MFKMVCRKRVAGNFGGMRTLKWAQTRYAQTGIARVVYFIGGGCMLAIT
jgi:hypothetical protein